MPTKWAGGHHASLRYRVRNSVFCSATIRSNSHFFNSAGWTAPGCPVAPGGDSRPVTLRAALGNQPLVSPWPLPGALTAPGGQSPCPSRANICPVNYFPGGIPFECTDPGALPLGQKPGIPRLGHRRGGSPLNGFTSTWESISTINGIHTPRRPRNRRFRCNTAPIPTGGQHWLSAFREAYLKQWDGSFALDRLPRIGTRWPLGIFPARSQTIEQVAGFE